MSIIPSLPVAAAAVFAVFGWIRIAVNAFCHRSGR